MIAPENVVYKPGVYELPLGMLHIPTMSLEVDEAQYIYARSEWDIYHYAGHVPDYTESVRGLHDWGSAYTQMLPARLDLALDVDGAGFIKHQYEPTLSTRWVEVDEGEVFLRFSQARTAKHGNSVLRSPVMGGIAIEATSDPDSMDIRAAHTMFIVEKARYERDLSWEGQSTRTAQLFDLSEFKEEPLTAGPLYNGHPNRVVSEAVQEQVVKLGLDMLEELRNTTA